MGKLLNMRVERVDGVGSPATGLSWVILKSKDAPEAVEKAEAVSKAASDAVTALLKEAGLELSQETVDVLKTLAELLEVEGEFTAKADEPAADEPEDAPEGDAPEGDAAEGDEPEDGDVEKDTFSKDEIEGLVEAALDKLGVDVEKSAAKGQLVRKDAAASRQPEGTAAGDDERRLKKGDGLFSNIIFPE